MDRQSIIDPSTGKTITLVPVPAGAYFLLAPVRDVPEEIAASFDRYVTERDVEDLASRLESHPSEVTLFDWPLASLD